MIVQIELRPIGKLLEVPRGTPLQDVLFAHGVEFPCGGRGLCRGCKIKVLKGGLPITPEDRVKLSEGDLSHGWRLACRAAATEDLVIELEQWEASILSDYTTFEFKPQAGYGIAVDLGTTTIVAQLLNLSTGEVLAVRAALNDQARHGADIMSRVEFGVTAEGLRTLTDLVRRQIGDLIRQLLSDSLLVINQSTSTSGTAPSPLVPPAPIPIRIVLVGNTVMHHLFCGISVEPLSHYPFEPESPGMARFYGEELGWDFIPQADVCFLPCLGGFVGSDILAGILATRLHLAETPSALVDLGTNGEIVVAKNRRLLCTSTAAGPAFEGARISMGMRAATGAISEVHVENGTLRCHVLGNVTPRGICGSGLVDAAAAGLDLGFINPRGRLLVGEHLPLSEPVSLNQWDIRELQLAKGAIAAGLRLLAQNLGCALDDLKHVYLAGAFGNYINQASARRIGLLQFPPERIHPSGNTALLGAKIALFSHDLEFSDVLKRTTHLSLKADPAFQDAYVDEMSFPSSCSSSQSSS